MHVTVDLIHKRMISIKGSKSSSLHSIVRVRLVQSVLVLSFVSQMVMPKVFQCDLEAVKRLVAGLEADPTSVTSQELVQAIIDERCDGGKNFQKELYIYIFY